MKSTIPGKSLKTKLDNREVMLVAKESSRWQLPSYNLPTFGGGILMG
jgi:hypothetical protein